MKSYIDPAMTDGANEVAPWPARDHPVGDARRVGSPRSPGGRLPRRAALARAGSGLDGVAEAARPSSAARARDRRPSLLPLLAWSAVSYLPFLWHPLVAISDPGDVDYLAAGDAPDRAAFDDEVANAEAARTAPPSGTPANPVYLPAPHEVARRVLDLARPRARRSATRSALP